MLFSASLRRIALAVLVLAGLLLGMPGCAESVRMPVEHPPLLPVRVYPSIVVLHRDAPNERQFADAIAAHLRASSDANVQVMTELEIARLPTGLPAGTVVLQLRIDSAQSMRLSYVPTYASSCGFYSCMPTTMTTAVPVVTFTTRLSAMLRDGATAQILVARSADEQGDAVDTQVVLSHLFRQLVTWVDGRRDVLSASVRSPRDTRVKHAIDELGRGRFAEARAALEAIVAEPGFGQQSRRSRARTLFAVAVARRFDPTFGDDVVTRFAAARDACMASLAMDDDGHTRSFCGRLVADESDARALRAMQLDAARQRSAQAMAASSSDPHAAPNVTATMGASAAPSFPNAFGAPTPQSAFATPPNAGPTAPSAVIQIPDPAYSGTR